MARRSKSLSEIGRTSPIPDKSTRSRTKVWKHPDRQALEAMLITRAAYSVERWLAERYPDEPDMRVSRARLIEYRDKYLVTEDWTPPVEDNPLKDVTPVRIDKNHPLWEFDALTAQVEALEYLAAQAIKQDSELGLIQETTVEALSVLGKALKDRAELAAKLGLPGYVEAAKKLQIEQSSVNVEVRAHAGLPVAPDSSRLEVARALLSMSPEERAQLALEAQNEPDIVDAEVIDEHENP